MQTSELLRKQALDKNGNNIGKVVDIDIDLLQWTVICITLKIGLIKKLSVDVNMIDKVGDKIILKITKDELGKGRKPE